MRQKGEQAVSALRQNAAWIISFHEDSGRFIVAYIALVYITVSSRSGVMIFIAENIFVVSCNGTFIYDNILSCIAVITNVHLSRYSFMPGRANIFN